MARLKLPDPLSRRHLLEGRLDEAKALALARAYLEVEREVEAIDFLSAAGGADNEEAAGLLRELQASALSRGDVFLMKSASRALGEEPANATWRALADAAAASGRSRDAEAAARLATVGE
ncbi:MAG TPA: hypothetical protein ENI85_07860 [Deltaproteobacteria bacterium]|nr:hypothetical protein [Deltaproteobacteria bacterium]